jgi:hypothetical protein
LAFGFWLLAFGFWLLAFGFWLLAFGFWLLAFGGCSNSINLLVNNFSARFAASALLSLKFFAGRDVLQGLKPKIYKWLCGTTSQPVARFAHAG